MPSLTAVLGPHGFGLRICLGAQGRSAMEGRTSQAAALSFRCWARAWRAVRFQSSECDTERWVLAARSWDCDWRRSNCSWGSFYVLLHVAQQNIVARLPIDESVWPNETSSGSAEHWSRHPIPWEHPSFGWYDPARNSYRPDARMWSKVQYLNLGYPTLLYEFGSQGIGFGLQFVAGYPE